MSTKFHSFATAGILLILLHFGAQAQDRPIDTRLATSNLGELTLGQLQQFTQASDIPALRGVEARNIPMMPPETLEEAAKYYMVRRAALAKLEATGNEQLIEMHKKSLQDYMPRAYQTLFVRQEIEAKRTVPSEQELQQYYKDHQQLFRQPFSFKMRHLIRLTYERYIVTSGDIKSNGPDDLKAIAKKVMGDEALAENIREDSAGRPLRYDPEKMFKPLSPGETLLIPMNDEKAAEKKKELQGIVAQMSGGKSFEELAETYSEAESKAEVIGPLPTGTRPILIDFMKNAKSLKVGAVSEPFRTKHGWQVMELVERTEEGIKPFETVKARIQKTLYEEEEKKLVVDALNLLFDDPDLKLEYDKIAKGNDLKDDEIVAAVGDVKVAWKDYRTAWQSQGYPTEPALIDKQAQYVPALQVEMLKRWAQRLISEPGSPYAELVEYIRTEQIGTSYLDTLTREKLQAAITDERMKEFYEAHKSEFVQPVQVMFESIDMVINAKPETTPEERLAMQDKLVAEMTDALSKIETKEDFISHASILNQSLLARDLRPFRTESPMPEANVLDGIREEMQQLKVGEWSKPIRYRDDHVISVLLTDRIPEHQMEFEEVKNQISTRLFQELKQEKLEETSQELLAQIDYKFVLED